MGFKSEEEHQRYRTGMGYIKLIGGIVAFGFFLNYQYTMHKINKSSEALKTNIAAEKIADPKKYNGIIDQSEYEAAVQDQMDYCASYVAGKSAPLGPEVCACVMDKQDTFAPTANEILLPAFLKKGPLILNRVYNIPKPILIGSYLSGRMKDDLVETRRHFGETYTPKIRQILELEILRTGLSGCVPKSAFKDWETYFQDHRRYDVLQESLLYISVAKDNYQRDQNRSKK